MRWHLWGASVSHSARMKSLLLSLVAALALVSSAFAGQSESMAERDLRQLVERQKELLADAYDFAVRKHRNHRARTTP